MLLYIYFIGAVITLILNVYDNRFNSVMIFKALIWPLGWLYLMVVLMFLAIVYMAGYVVGFGMENEI